MRPERLVGRRIALAAMLACASCAQRQPLHVYGVALVQPSLAAIAASARAMGGAVFVGEPTGATSALPPDVVPTETPNVFLSAPRVAGVVPVVDALGASVGTTEMLMAPSGPSSLVDAAGHESSEYYLAEQPSWSQYTLPSSGRWVFFATRSDHGARYVLWRAALDGELVDASGTTEGGQVPLDTLRLN